jgi:hypothetical protein
VVSNSSRHRGSLFQSHVDLGEVIVREVQRDVSRVVL